MDSSKEDNLSEDEFDVEALRLAALKSLRKPKFINPHNLISIVPVNVVTPIVNPIVKLEPISPRREQKFLEEKLQKDQASTENVPEKESSYEEETDEEETLELECEDHDDEDSLEKLMDKLEAEIEGKVAPQKTKKVKKFRKKKKERPEEEEVELVDVRIGRTKLVGPVINVRESATPEPAGPRSRSRSWSRNRSPRRFRSPRLRRWSRSRSRSRSISPRYRRRRTRSRSWSPSLPVSSRSPKRSPAPGWSRARSPWSPRRRSRSPRRQRSPPRRSRSPRLRSPPPRPRSPFRARSRSPPPRLRSPGRIRSPARRSRSPLPRIRSPGGRSRSPPSRPVRSGSPPPRVRSPGRSRSPPPRMRSRSPPPRIRSPGGRSRSPPPRAKSPVRSRSPRIRSRSPRNRSPRLRSKSPVPRSRSPHPQRSNRSPVRPRRRGSLSPPRAKQPRQSPGGRRRSQSPPGRRRPGPRGAARRSPDHRRTSPGRNKDRKTNGKAEEKKNEEEIPSGPVDPVLEARRRKFQSVPNPGADKKISLKALKETIEPLEEEGLDINLDSLWDDSDDSDGQEGRFKGVSQGPARGQLLSFRGIREGQSAKPPPRLDGSPTPGKGQREDRRRERLGGRGRREDRQRPTDRPRPLLENRVAKPRDKPPAEVKVAAPVSEPVKTSRVSLSDDFDEFVSAFEKELEGPSPFSCPSSPTLPANTDPEKPRISVKKDLFATAPDTDSRLMRRKGVKTEALLPEKEDVAAEDEPPDLRSILARRRKERLTVPLQPIKSSRLVQSALQSLVQTQESIPRVRKEPRRILMVPENTSTPFDDESLHEAEPRPRRRVRKVENVASAVSEASRGGAMNVAEAMDVAAPVPRRVHGIKLRRCVTIASQWCYANDCT